MKDRLPSSTEATTNCSLIVREFNKDFLEIDKKSFLNYYNELNNTLSGNLATVFRSEWKTKESFDSGGTYLDQLIQNFGGNEKHDLRTKSGKEKIDHFVSLLKEKKHLGFIGMRDPPVPSVMTLV